MPIRLRRILLSLPVLIVGGLVLIYLLLGWFAFEPWARSALPKMVAERSGYELKLEQARFDPLRLSIDLHGVVLNEPSGKTLLAVDRCFVDLDSWGLFRRTVTLDEVRIEKPVAALQVQAGGRINWMDFLDALEARQPASAPKPEEGSPARVLVRRFVLQQGRVDFSDTTVPGGFRTQLDLLDLSLDNLSTLPNAQGQHALDAHLATGANLRWKGSFGLNPLTAAGELALDNVIFASIWPYVGPRIGMVAPDGKGSVTLKYAAGYEHQRFALKLDPVTVHAEKFRFVDAGFVQPMTGELADLQLSFRAEAAFGSGPPAFDVQGLRLAASDVRLRSGKEGEPWLRLGRVGLDDGFVKLAQQEFGAAHVSVSDGTVNVERDAKGRITLAGAFERTAAAASAVEERNATWSYRVGKLEAGKLGVSVVDRSVSPPAGLTLENIQVAAQELGSDAKAAVPLQLSLDVKSGGRLEAKGSVVPATGAVDLQLSLKDLAIVPAQPYLASVAALSLGGGRIDTQGRVRYADGDARYEGQLAIRDLAVRDTTAGENFLSWKSLSTRRIAATSRKLDLGPVELAGLDTRVIISKERRLNLVDAFRPGGASAPAPAASAASAAVAEAPPPKTSPAYEVGVERIRVTDGRVDFADLSLALPFAARIHQLRGRLTDISNQAGRVSRIDLTGQVDEYGLARASGKLELLNPTDAMDLKLVFTNIEMTSLTPYTATFAGRRIASGKLSLDLDYVLDKRQLKGENKVVMDKLVLGERVDSPDAMDLPLDLALAILKDSEGRIDLGLPVYGSLDDPQFSYGKLFWKALGDLFKRVITSPFRAIGALASGDDKEGDQTPAITFEAGASELLPPEREKLDRMAAALAQRPALSLTIVGDADPQVDAQAMRRNQVRKAINEEMGRKAAPAADVAASGPDRPERRRALESLYEKAFGAEALRAASVQAGTVPLESSLLMQRLIEREPLADEQLVALANARAEAVRRHLAAKGMAAERLRVEPASPPKAQGTSVTLGVVAPAAETAASKP